MKEIIPERGLSDEGCICSYHASIKEMDNEYSKLESCDEQV